MFSVFVFVYADLAVVDPLPEKPVRGLLQVSAQCAHDAAVAGDQNIFIIAGLQLFQEGGGP